MANARTPGVVGIYSAGTDTGTLARASMPQPGVVGVNRFASPAEMEQAKRALAMDIGQLILDITGIFDPSPISDGTNLLISFARGNWVDVVASAVSIVPYIGDLAKTAKLPRYIKSVRQAIHIAKFDPKWADALRTLFAKLKKVLDECIILAEDLLPDAAKRQLKELKHEIDKFLSPRGGTTNKLSASGKKSDIQSSNSTKSQRNIDRTKQPEKLDNNTDSGYGLGKNNDVPKTTDTPKPKKYKNKPPTKKDIDLAKKPGKAAKQIAARRKVAAHFYEKQGMKESKISGHLQGIDFDQPVQVEKLSKGQRLTQYQAPGASQGNYYAPPGQKPSRLGISEYTQDWNTGEVVKKESRIYEVNKDVDALGSKAAKIEDTWSIPDKPISTEGGGKQYFTMERTNFDLVGK